LSRDGSIRGFVALEIEGALRRSLDALQQRLRPALGGIRLTRSEGIHLTLRFLGTTSPAQASAIEPSLRAAARACPPPTARVRGLGTFPGRGSPRVLWLGVELPPPAFELQRACEQAARGAGFPPAERPFRAHLTLGRWSERAARPELPDVDLGETRLESLALFRSETRPEGASYTPLQRFPLGAG
jgi:RNA 2',3'-cyclic 3'-phosphodiesterase